MLRVDTLRVPGLAPVSFSLSFGDCLAVQGTSGAGKTRLLRAIADLDQCDGHLLLDGVSRSELSGPDWRRRVRYVSSEPAWWAPTPRPHFTDVEFLADASRLASLLQSVGLRPELLDRSLAELSTGERLRLALIRSLADEPRVMLFDEPTAQLDPTNAGLAELFIRTMIAAGRAVIVVSHERGLIQRLARRRLQITDGNVWMEAV